MMQSHSLADVKNMQFIVLLFEQRTISWQN